MAPLHREREVLSLLVDGNKIPEIAKLMGLSALTVKGYIAKLSSRRNFKGSPYNSTIRLIYLEARDRGLLPNWPD